MNNTTKGCLIILVILLGVIVIAFAMCSGGDKETLPDDLTAEEAFIAGVVGYETNHDDYPVKLIEVTLSGDILKAKLVGDDNLSSSWVKTGIYSASQDLFAAAFDEYPEIERVFIYWHFPMVDKLGNVSLDEVITIGLIRETAESINWENFNTGNFPDVADSYWQHPAFD